MAALAAASRLPTSTSLRSSALMSRRKALLDCVLEEYSRRLRYKHECHGHSKNIHDEFEQTCLKISCPGRCCKSNLVVTAEMEQVTIPKSNDKQTRLNK